MKVYAYRNDTELELLIQELYDKFICKTSSRVMTREKFIYIRLYKKFFGVN